MLQVKSVFARRNPELFQRKEEMRKKEKTNVKARYSQNYQTGNNSSL